LSDFVERRLCARCAHGIPTLDRCHQCSAEQQKQVEIEATPIVSEVLARRRKLHRVRRENLTKLTFLTELDPNKFEYRTHELYRKLGWHVTATKSSGDRGVDGFLRRDGQVLVLECKRLS